MQSRIDAFFVPRLNSTRCERQLGLTHGPRTYCGRNTQNADNFACRGKTWSIQTLAFLYRDSLAWKGSGQSSTVDRSCSVNFQQLTRRAKNSAMLAFAKRPVHTCFDLVARIESNTCFKQTFQPRPLFAQIPGDAESCLLKT